jgi:transcription antitermination factor NusG
MRTQPVKSRIRFPGQNDGGDTENVLLFFAFQPEEKALRGSGGLAGACPGWLLRWKMMQFCEGKLNSGNGLGWFALRVRANHEKTVSNAIAKRGFEEFLPLYKARKSAKRSRDVETPLFPGYVFCRFDRSSWVPVIQAPGVIDVVRYGTSLAVIEDTEIASLQRMQRLRATMEPWPYFQQGDSVKINAGPLAGVRGTLVEVKRLFRLVLSVSLLQRSVLVEVERDWVV